MYQNSKMSKLRTLFCAAMLLSVAAGSTYADGSKPSSPRAQQSADQQENEQTSPPVTPSFKGFTRDLPWLFTLRYFVEEAKSCKDIRSLTNSSSLADDLTKLKPLPFWINWMLQGLAKKMNVPNVTGVSISGLHLDSSANAWKVGERGFVGLDLETARLSLRELRFVLGHELAHIKHNDTQVTISFSEVLIGLYGLALCSALYGQKWDSKLLRYPLLAVLVHSVACKTLDMRQEYAADAAAARALNSSTGGVKFFMRLNPNFDNAPRMRLIDCAIGGALGGKIATYAIPEDSNLTERQRKVIKVLSWIAGGFAGYKLGICSRSLALLLDSHPTDAQRIRALKRLNLG